MKQCLQFGSWKRWGNTHCVCICIYIYTYGYIVHSRVLYSVSSVSYHIRKFRPLGLGGVEGWGDSGWVWGVGGLGLGVGVWGGLGLCVCQHMGWNSWMDYTNVLSIYTHTYEYLQATKTGIHTEPTKAVNTSAVSSHPPRPQKRGAPPSHLSARHSELKN